MADMDFQVWARLDPSDPSTNMEITSLPMLKQFATGLKEDLFSDANKNKQLVIWFLNQTKYRGVSAEKMADMLFQSNFSTSEQAHDALRKNRIYMCFDDLEMGPDIPYLDGEQTAQDYLASASKLTNSLPEGQRFSAAARIAVNSMILAILPENLPDRLRRAMLAPWRSGNHCVISVSGSTRIEFRWKHIHPTRVPQLKILRNQGLFPVELILSTESQGVQSIWLPAKSSLASVWVGQYMTCIKGALCVNGDYAACPQDGQIGKYRVSRDRYTSQALEDPDGLLDCALHTNGRLHLLEGGNARLWDNMILQSLPNVIGIYAQGTTWLVHKEDGSTYSNIRRLCQKDVIAIAQDEQDILLMTRSGQICSLSQKPRSAEDFWACMIRRFRDLPGEEAAERLVYRETEILRTRKGALLCRPQGSKGD